MAEEIAHLMVVIKQGDKNWEEWGSQQSLSNSMPHALILHQNLDFPPLPNGTRGLGSNLQHMDFWGNITMATKVNFHQEGGHHRMGRGVG